MIFTDYGLAMDKASWDCTGVNVIFVHLILSGGFVSELFL
jgi:hypothetical protein